MYLLFDIYTKLQNCSKFCNRLCTSKTFYLPLSWCAFFYIQDPSDWIFLLLILFVLHSDTLYLSNALCFCSLCCFLPLCLFFSLISLSPLLTCLPLQICLPLALWFLLSPLSNIFPPFWHLCQRVYTLIVYLAKKVLFTSITIFRVASQFSIATSRDLIWMVVFATRWTKPSKVERLGSFFNTVSA